MKKTIAFLFTSLIAMSVFAAFPVTWTYSVKKLGAGLYEVHLTAQVDKGWHLYAQRQPEDAIAVPTTIKFVHNPLLAFNGKPSEIGAMQKVKYESLNIEAWQYNNKVDFVQKVSIKRKVKTNVTGTIEFQVCTDRQCLPPVTQQFSLSINS